MRGSSSALGPGERRLAQREVLSLRGLLAARVGPVVHGLDVVSVGVDDESGVIVAAVRALSRRTVVASARTERRRVELVDLLRARRGQRDMTAGSDLAGQLQRKWLIVIPAVTDTEPERLGAVVHELVSERSERDAVEIATGGQVAHGQLHVVDRHARNGTVAGASYLPR